METTMTESEVLAKMVMKIANKFAKRIRRADNIDLDPEGQRIKGEIGEAIYEFLNTVMPADEEGKTVHITQADKQMKEVHKGIHEVIREAIAVGKPAEPMWTGICKQCNRIHDPRKNYNHAATNVLPEPAE